MTSRRGIRKAALFGMAALYIASVPWYWPGQDETALRVWWGLPDWVAVALGCYVGVAVLNAIAWWMTEMPEESEPGAEGPDTEPLQ